jgi:hypothetical protein
MAPIHNSKAGAVPTFHEVRVTPAKAHSLQRATTATARVDQFAAAPRAASVTAARTMVDTAVAKFEARLRELPSNAEGTRGLRAAFTADRERVDTGLSRQTMTPGEAQTRAQQWSALADTLITGHDPLEVTSSSGGLTFYQSARVRLEAAGDWGLTTRREGQDLQAFVARSMLEGGGSWDQGLATLQKLAAPMPAPGQSQTLEERSAMLGGLRQVQREYFESTERAPATFRATSPGAPALASRALESAGVATSFITAAITDPLHYFSVDVRNPATGKPEQNVYHLDPATGVLTQVSNLDAQGQRLQAPKSGPWTAGPLAGGQAASTAPLEAQLAALGVRFVDSPTGRSAVLDKDLYLQSQSDGSYKLWKGVEGKREAIDVPEAALRGLTFTGGNRAKAVPQTAANVRGERIEVSADQLAARGFQVSRAGGQLRLELNDNIAYWVDAQGRLNLQDRTGPQGVDHGNPDHPIFTLSAADTARVADVHGNGWGYVLSDWSAPKSALNPKPGCSAWGAYTRGADGAPVATMNDL